MEKLPKLQDLYSGELSTLKNQNDLNLLLNQSPPEKWIKKHPFAKGVKYLSIQRIEFLLTSIFIKWKVEVKEIKLVANSIVCSIRLHYLNPIDGQWDWHDGVGAAPVHTSKGKGATDFDHIQADSVMKATPAAKSFAVKDATHNIGKIFGKDLVRNDEISYNSLENKFPEEKLNEVFENE